MKIRPVGAELAHADRRTDMTKLTVAFRNFASAPNNSLPHYKLKLPVNPYKVSTISFFFQYLTSPKMSNEIYTVKLCLCCWHTPIKNRESKAYIYPSQSSEWSASRSVHLPPAKRTSWIQWTRCRVSSRAFLDVVEKRALEYTVYTYITRVFVKPPALAKLLDRVPHSTSTPLSWPTKQTLLTPKCLIGQYFEPTESLETNKILKKVLTIYTNAIIIPRATDNSVTPQLCSHTFAYNSFSQKVLLAEPFRLRKITRNQTSFLTN
jgi:hypothetical protein